MILFFNAFQCQNRILEELMADDDVHENEIKLRNADRSVCKVNRTNYDKGYKRLKSDNTWSTVDCLVGIQHPECK